MEPAVLKCCHGSLCTCYRNCMPWFTSSASRTATNDLKRHINGRSAASGGCPCPDGKMVDGEVFICLNQRIVEIRRRATPAAREDVHRKAGPFPATIDKTVRKTVKEAHTVHQEALRIMRQNYPQYYAGPGAQQAQAEPQPPVPPPPQPPVPPPPATAPATSQSPNVVTQPPLQAAPTVSANHIVLPTIPRPHGASSALPVPARMTGMAQAGTGAPVQPQMPTTLAALPSQLVVTEASSATASIVPQQTTTAPAATSARSKRPRTQETGANDYAKVYNLQHPAAEAVGSVPKRSRRNGGAWECAKCQHEVQSSLAASCPKKGCSGELRLKTEA